MNGEFQTELHAAEGTLTLNGPRMWTDREGKVGNLWVWATVVRGQVMTTAFVLDLGVEQDSLKYQHACESCKHDLEYAVGYVTNGCKAEEPPAPHRFMGNPEDVSTVLVCLDCGQVKKRGFSLPGLVDMTGGAKRASGPSVP